MTTATDLLREALEALDKAVPVLLAEGNTPATRNAIGNVEMAKSLLRAVVGHYTAKEARS